jgi:hypothetical protein
LAPTGTAWDGGTGEERKKGDRAGKITSEGGKEKGHCLARKLSTTVDYGATAFGV